MPWPPKDGRRAPAAAAAGGEDPIGTPAGNNRIAETPSPFAAAGKRLALRGAGAGVRILQAAVGRERLFRAAGRAARLFAAAHGDTLLQAAAAWETGRPEVEVVCPLPRFGFSLVVSGADAAIGLELLRHGVWEAPVVEAMLPYLKPNTRFLDVGANVGFFTLLAAGRCPRGRVIAFEPDPENYRLLQMSLRLNGCEGIVTAHPFAVTDEDTELVLSDLGAASNSGARFVARDSEALRPHVHGPDPWFRSVRGVRLDTFLAGEDVDVLKMDIEGHEPFALQGMTDLLERCRPVVFAEFAPGNLQSLGHTEPEEFLRFFTDRGYRLNAIGADGSLVECGADADAFLRLHAASGEHHTDLLLLP